MARSSGRLPLILTVVCIRSRVPDFPVRAYHIRTMCCWGAPTAERVSSFLLFTLLSLYLLSCFLELHFAPNGHRSRIRLMMIVPRDHADPFSSGFCLVHRLCLFWGSDGDSWRFRRHRRHHSDFPCSNQMARAGLLPCGSETSTNPPAFITNNDFS